MKIIRITAEQLLELLRKGEVDLSWDENGILSDDFDKMEIQR